MEKYLIISVQDVAPANQSQLETILQRLDQEGITKRSLALIPKYEGTYLFDDKKTVNLIAQEKELNNEFCLHGYDHSKGWLYREFSSIQEDDAFKRLNDSLTVLRNIDLQPEVFIPPYFKLSLAGERALNRQGFNILLKNPLVKNLTNGQLFYSTPLSFWYHQKGLNWLFQAYNQLLRHKLRNNDLIRVDLHPQDLKKGKPFEYALQLLRELKEERTLTSYREYLDTKYQKNEHGNIQSRKRRFR